MEREREAAGGGNDLAIQGWASPLTIFVVAVLIIESLSGLWIYLAPFSLVSQLQVLAHSVLGLLLLLPFFHYAIGHLLTWFRQKQTVVLLLGYLLLLLLLLCIMSGGFLTWQAALGPKRSENWDLIHLITGTAACVLLVVHLLMAFSRRGHALSRQPELAAAARRFSMQTAAWVSATALLIFLGALAWPQRPVDLPLPEGYSLSGYLEQFDEYRGSPFAPTYARTASGMLVDPEVISHSESCGSAGCHEQILAEWQPSAHRFSAMNPPFQEVQLAFAKDRDVAETRYCAGCHDPISLFAGAKDIAHSGLEAPGAREGASCAVCHSISKVDQRGNGDYVLTPPDKYIGESSQGTSKFISDFLIRAYPRQHLEDYDRNLLRTPEFCGACHKQFIPEALNRFGLSPSQNQFDEWRESHWHSDDPEEDLSCRDCHMRLVQNSHDPGRGEVGDARRSADDGSHRHHGTIATNSFMPEVLKLENWQQHVKLTEEWIRGETIIPEIADRWPEGPVASLKILGPDSVRPGEKTSVRVVVTNRKAGHNFTTGPLDFVRSWVHLSVRNADGAVLAEWGGIDPESRAITDSPGKIHEVGNPRDSGTLVLEAQPLDAEGRPLVKHELWKKAGGKGGRTIFPRYSDNQIYRFTAPAVADGPLTLHAELNFRRYRQEFLDLVVPDMERESGVYQATLTHDQQVKTIQIQDGLAMLDIDETPRTDTP